jgi:hypothetical protein
MSGCPKIAANADALSDLVKHGLRHGLDRLRGGEQQVLAERFV